ncbi:hypothetical protein Pmar_PMAR021109 [Perkinsus marinus ATCC 50983]|uniref:WWE domain-containing protein n=1 Tax=Perkinsus marinus (strain ATCC 50983 / TXsc) TaxID=423536 RepID=C5KGF3_PERM5|nr:hypothetical protein Pmar_PMAR021109 [Perkinsus marinus ATCC 50983]EER16509.1 hypothetical protein Pmar_PMAR021109 [Perkinsus marinus ATCC 50983]|eukprot:XP_002784713.1 hypothetical protein Pmar_PMAR021109 [Perkinsus marinus ATCC 50983]
MGEKEQSILQRAQTQALQGNFNEAITNYAESAAETEFVAGEYPVLDHCDTNHWIRFRLNPNARACYPEPVGAWEWKDASGDWLPLPPTAAEIADEAQRGGIPNTIIDLGDETFMVNVIEGTMVSLLTKQQTEIRRIR